MTQKITAVLRASMINTVRIRHIDTGNRLLNKYYLLEQKIVSYSHLYFRKLRIKPLKLKYNHNVIQTRKLLCSKKKIFSNQICILKTDISMGGFVLIFIFSQLSFLFQFLCTQKFYQIIVSYNLQLIVQFIQIISVRLSSISGITMESRFCHNTTCSEGCCNFYGLCIDPLSTSKVNRTCFYNYSKPDTCPAQIIGIFVAFFIITIALIVISVYICKKKPTSNKPKSSEPMPMDPPPSEVRTIIKSNENLMPPLSKNSQVSYNDLPLKSTVSGSIYDYQFTQIPERENKDQNKENQS